MPDHTRGVAFEVHQVRPPPGFEPSNRLSKRRRPAFECRGVQDFADGSVGILVDRATLEGEPLAVLQRPQLEVDAYQGIAIGTNPPGSTARFK